jgi:hypothetical protein
MAFIGNQAHFKEDISVEMNGKDHELDACSSNKEIVESNQLSFGMAIMGQASKARVAVMESQAMTRDDSIRGDGRGDFNNLQLIWDI